MAGPYLFDLKDPDSSWSGVAYSYFPNGSPSSKVGSITPPVGPRGLYWMLDTIMYKMPEDAEMETSHMPHYHNAGYETFFVDSGKLYLFINGQRVLCQKGDIVHLQAGQSHGMYFLEDVKWRGTYHDYIMAPESGEIGAVMRKLPEAKDDPE